MENINKNIVDMYKELFPKGAATREIFVEQLNQALDAFFADGYPSSEILEILVGIKRLPKLESEEEKNALQTKND